MMKYISLSVFLLSSVSCFGNDYGVALALISGGKVTFNGTMRINADDGEQYEIMRFSFSNRGYHVTYHNGHREVTARFLYKKPETDNTELS